MEIFKLFGTIAVNTANAIGDLGNLATQGAKVAGALGADIEAAGARGLKGIGGMSQGIIGSLGTIINPVTLTVGAFAGIVDIGKKANEAFGDFEGVMKNVSTLIDADGVGAITKFGDGLLKISVDTGKGIKDLGDGLYQVISAVGETADSLPILAQNAKAAAGGLATTEQAIGLSSAVTKAWGDTTKEANLKALDLAQTAVKLGKTTFPEMADAIGKVAPLAHTLNITQEELFASMSSLSGVTGSTAEVSTQLQNVYNALLKPTKDMQTAFGSIATDLDSQQKLVGGPLTDAWREAHARFEESSNKLNALQQALKATDTTTKEGKESAKDLKNEIKEQSKEVDALEKLEASRAAGLGQVIIQSQGFGATIKSVSDYADGNTAALGKMFGSVQAINAVNALGGPLAKDFADKVRGMGDAAGASNEAFQKNIDEGAQFGAALNAVLVKIGAPIDGIIDSLSVLGTGALKGLLELINGLSGAQIPKDSPLSGLADAFSKLGAAIAPLVSTAWDKILKPLFEILKPLAEGAFQVVLERLKLFVNGISTFVAAITQLLQGDIVGAIKTLFNGIIEQFAGLGKIGLTIGEAILKSLAATPIGKILEPFIAGIGDAISTAFNAATGFVDSAISSVKTGFSNLSTTAKDALASVGDTLKSINFSKMFADAPGIISSFITSTLEQIQTAFSNGLNIGKRILDSIANTPVGQALKPFTDAIGAGFDGAFKSIGNFIQPIIDMLKPLGEGVVKVALERFDALVQGFNSFKDAITQLLQGDLVGSVKTLFNGMIDQFKSLGGMGLIIGEAILKSLASTPIGKVLEPFVTGIAAWLREAFTNAIGFVDGAVTTIKNGLGNAVTTVADFMKSVGDTVSNGFSSVGTTISSIFNSIGSTISSGFSSTVASVKDVFNSIGDGLKSIDVSKLISDVPGVIQTFAGNVASGLKTALTSTLDLGKSVLDSIANTPVAQILKPFTDAIGAGFDGAFKSVGNFIQPIIEMLKPLGEGAVKVALERFDALVKGFNSFKDAISKLASGDLVGSVKTLFNGMIDQFKSLGGMGLIIGEAILKSLASTPIGKLLKPFTDGLQKVLSDAWELLKDPKQLFAIGENIISSLVSSIKKEAARVSIVAGEIAGKILKGFTDLPKALLDIGNAIVEGITKGIKDNIDKLTNGLKALGEGAIKTLKGLLGIKSPSRVMYEEVGLPIVQGIALGITDNIDLVINAARDLTRGVKNALDQIAHGDYAQAIGELLRGISDAFNFGGDGVDTAVNSFVQGVQGALTSLAKGDWVSAIVAVVAGAVNAIIDLFDGANKSFQEANKKLNNTINQFSVIDGSVFVKITQESRGWFADLFGGPATVATINEFGVKLAHTLENGLLSGVTNGIKAFFDGGSILENLRSGIRDAVISAITDAVIKSAILKGALGGLLTELSEAFSNGGDPSAVIAKIGAALPGLASSLETLLTPLKDSINAAFPKVQAGSGVQTPNGDSGLFLAPPIAAQGTYGLNSDAIPRFENAVTMFSSGVENFRGSTTDYQGATGSLTTVINRLVNEGIRVSSIGANGLSTDLQVL